MPSMRVGTLALALFLVATARTAGAQCPSSSGLTCSPIRPFGFGLQGSRTRPEVQFMKPALVVPSPGLSGPIDCKILKPVDPQFASTMPIIQPAPGPRSAKRIVPVPSCQQDQAAPGLRVVK
jgi:hypothetical protein